MIHTYKYHTDVYYWVWCNLIHGRKVNDLGKRFHATHINRQARRLITTLYEYLPLVSINNTAALWCSCVLSYCVLYIQSHRRTYSRFFIPFLLIRLQTIAFNEFLLNVFSFLRSYHDGKYAATYVYKSLVNIVQLYKNILYSCQKIRQLLFLQLRHSKAWV